MRFMRRSIVRARPSSSAAYARSASTQLAHLREEPADRSPVSSSSSVDRRCRRSSARFTWKIRSGVG